MAEIKVSEGWYILDKEWGFIAVDRLDNFPMWVCDVADNIPTRCRITVEILKDKKGRFVRRRAY